MHHSRLAGLAIDCQSDDLETHAAFWGAALGMAVLPQNPEAGEENYRDLKPVEGQPYVILQKVTHPSRVHLDIETDDIEAEVKRLEALGARRVAQIRRWWVMEAPSGHRFCVVPPQRPDFPAGATTWP